MAAAQALSLPEIIQMIFRFIVDDRPDDWCAYQAQYEDGLCRVNSRWFDEGIRMFWQHRPASYLMGISCPVRRQKYAQKMIVLEHDIPLPASKAMLEFPRLIRYVFRPDGKCNEVWRPPPQLPITLREIEIWDGPVVSETLSEIPIRFPKLNRLVLHGIWDTTITPHQLTEFLGRLAHLSSLELTSCQGLVGENVLHFIGRELDLRTFVCDHPIRQLFTALTTRSDEKPGQLETLECCLTGETLPFPQLQHLSTMKIIDVLLDEGYRTPHRMAFPFMMGLRDLEIATESSDIVLDEKFMRNVQNLPELRRFCAKTKREGRDIGLPIWEHDHMARYLLGFRQLRIFDACGVNLKYKAYVCTHRQEMSHPDSWMSPVCRLRMLGREIAYTSACASRWEVISDPLGHKTAKRLCKDPAVSVYSEEGELLQKISGLSHQYTTKIIRSLRQDQRLIFVVDEGTTSC